MISWRVYPARLSLFDEWQFFEAKTCAGRLPALVRLSKAHQSRKQWEQAIGFARRWLSLDTLHEPAHRLLMELYDGAGQVSAALRQYEVCVQILEAS